MNQKECMLAAIRGEPLDRIPWVPRLDLWYRANRYNGTLPTRYRKASLDEILADNGFGYHAVVPDFKDLRTPDDEADRGLGIYNLAMIPFRTEFPDAQRSVAVEGDVTRTAYGTPHGTITTAAVYNESMRQAGITITHVSEHAFKSAADYRALTWLFDHARVTPNYEGYDAFRQRIGDRGLACAFVGTAASPMHMIQKELIPYDLFFLEMADHPDEMAALARAIGRFWEQIMAIAAGSTAEVVWGGGNFDATMTYPPFFAEHITPWIRRFADQLHGVGKYLLCHTDGENTGLLEEYLEAGFDIADSVCPAPMTRLTFGQVREVFGDRIAIMGGIPSVILLKSSMHDRDFDQFLDRFFEQVGKGNRLILGVSDTTPPDADFERLVLIGKRIEEFGKVG